MKFRSPADRRVVLKRLGLVAVCGLVPGGLVLGCGPEEPEGVFPGSPKNDDLKPETVQPLPSGVATINVNQIAVGAAVFAVPQLFICRDADGVYAMTTICTHSQCDMGSQAAGCGIQDPDDLTQGFDCCCHGSSYDGNGNVVGGPAPDPLVHYRVVVDAAGVIWVDRDVVVDPSARTAVG